jgi:DNA polymerase elongation subunit (family B)
MGTYLPARKSTTKLIVKERIDTRLPSEGTLKIFKGKTKYLEVEYGSYANNIFTLKQPLTKDVPVDCDVGISFMGGYVKLPIPGLYKWIFSIDATSLYPSILRTLGISPESKAGKILNWTNSSLVNYITSDNKLDIKNDNNFQYIADDAILKVESLDRKTTDYNKQDFISFIKKNDLSIASNGVMYYKDKANIIPNILTLWFNLRLEYKDKLKKAKQSKDPQLIAYYDNMQLVVKILLNSVYGVLGMPGFRFYDPHNAEAVTSTGQNVIKFTANLIFNYYKQQYNNTNSPVIYGDTDSAYIQIDESVTSKSEAEIINYADAICGLANKGLNIFAKYGLNTTTSVLEFKREKVCKSGLFLAKKRYGLHVIDSEGDTVDYISVTGIDIKRSSYPKYFKGGLNRILEGILKFEDKPTIDNYIYEIEKNLGDCDILDLCKTSAVKDLDKYIKLSDGFIFKKGIPAHGKAALRYNLLLNKFDCDVKFTPIQSSEKIKWCYVTNNPYGVQNIGLKNEDNPPELLEFAHTYIDRKKMFEKELKGKIETFYKALDWKYPSNLKKLKITF